MAATTYSSLVSLMNILTRYQHPTCPVFFNQSQIHTLLNKVTLLVDFLEDYYDPQWKVSRGSIQHIEDKMTRAANAAEEIIQSYYVKGVIGDASYNDRICSDIEKATQEMDEIIQQTMEVGVKKQKKYHSMGNQRAKMVQSREGKHETTPASPLQFSHLMDRVRMRSSTREIIPIVGMGGIGKTTLATSVYNNMYARRHFDIRAWVTISQQYVVKDIIFSLLKEIKVEGNDYLNEEQVGDKLYKELCGRRYLIVLDDIWDIQAWNKIMRFFPDNRNGSRILLTTRICGVARSVGSLTTHEMKFLDDDETFKLLSEKVYGSEVFPSELEILGKAIAKSCKGLPLAAVVIGGLLKTCSKTLEYWREFAENLNSIISKDNTGQWLGILSLSYIHLPIHLKPCFLHMATFKEDEKIDVSNLVNLWIAEGFVKPANDKISTEIALEYLNDLIDRNLIMVGKEGWVSMHDSIRELSLAGAENENFICVSDDYTPNLQQRLECERRIIYKHSKERWSTLLLPSMPHACSLYVTKYRGWFPIRLASLCGLLRVVNMDESELLMDFVELVNIRHLAMSIDNNVEEWLSRALPCFWNLETLILKYSYTKPSEYYGHYGVSVNKNPYLPSNIWELPHLRHLELGCCDISLPNPTGGQGNNNLQTIRGVSNFSCTDKVFRLIPNLKELSTWYGYDEFTDLSQSFNNLALLSKLQTLSLSFRSPYCGYKKLTFTPSIVELTLGGSAIPWEYMTIVGRLPNLEVLKLNARAFGGNDWNPVEGEFQRLKKLSIVQCRLSIWNAESCHFPKLEFLRVDVLGFKEIPLGIGEIQSLEHFEFAGNEISIFISAKEMLDERRDNYGDDDDDLSVTGYYYGFGWNEHITEVRKWAEDYKNFTFKHR